MLSTTWKVCITHLFTGIKDQCRKGSRKIQRIRAQNYYKEIVFSGHIILAADMNSIHYTNTHEMCASSSQIKSQHGDGGSWISSPIPSFRTIGSDSFWERYSRFSLRIWALMGQSNSSGRPNIQVHKDSTNWTSWIIRDRERETERAGHKVEWVGKKGRVWWEIGCLLTKCTVHNS